MSGNGGRRLVVNCSHCRTQLRLPVVAYFVGQSVRCGVCYGSTRLTVPNLPRSRYSSVPYWVPINPPKGSSGAAPKKGKAKSSNSSTNGNAKAKSSNTSTKGNLKAKSSNPSTTSNWTAKPSNSSSTNNLKAKSSNPSTTSNCTAEPSNLSSTNNGKLKAKSSNSSTNNGKLSTPSQTQITEDEILEDDQDTEDENSEDDQHTEDEISEDDQKTEDKVPENDQKPSIVVNGNQVSGNTGDRNGGFSVGNTTTKHTFHARNWVVNVPVKISACLADLARSSGLIENSLAQTKFVNIGASHQSHVS